MNNLLVPNLSIFPVMNYSYQCIAPFSSCNSYSSIIIDRYFLICCLLGIYLLGLILSKWIEQKKIKELKDEIKNLSDMLDNLGGG